MTTDLHSLYLQWLESQVRHEGATPRHRTFHELCAVMHGTEFVWLVLGDDSRIADGLGVRSEFLEEHVVGAVPALGPPSVLEVMLGLTRRLSWELGGTNQAWAWTLLNNLDLHRYADPLSRLKRRRLDEKLSDLVWRNYLPTGEGGFFPLHYPTEDQTKVELWYQMNQWMTELNL